MVKRFSRKKAKKDEFVSTIEQIYEFSQKRISKHYKIILSTIAIVVLAGIASFSWNYYRNSKEEQAYLLLNQALKHFEAIVLEPEENAPQGTTEPIFRSEEEKYQSSIKHLQEVIDKYPSTPSSAAAEYYQGLCYAYLNRFDEAMNKFHKSLKGPLSKIMVPLARYALARSYEAKKDYEQALKIYKKILKKNSDFVSPPETLMKLGLCYEKLNQIDKAIEQYRKIVNDFEDSIYKSTAQDKLDAIAPPALHAGPIEE